jgi:ABC-type uncharacterized transport system permease subunit
MLKTIKKYWTIISITFQRGLTYQLYLKKIDLITGLKGLGVQIIWIIILYFIIKLVWNRGLKKYEGVGI